MLALASAPPSPQDLYERLRELNPDLSEERLARKLDLASVQTLRRLKRGEGVEFETTIQLLKAAGWLDLNGDATTRAQLDQAKREMQQLNETLERVLSIVP